MKIRMRVSISGTRSGVDWPPAGSVMEVDDVEGMHLCAGGLAEPVAEDPVPAETAIAPEPEKRGPGRPRTRPTDG